ncbi:MAG: hypothetical protein HKN29_14805 [Rhodothermales bacterium]|nr:hypothetical protein [Rhodothermales bacterium]
MREAWEQFTVDESGWNVGKHEILLSKSEVSLEAYETPIEALLAQRPVQFDASNLVLLRILTTNPFSHELESSGFFGSVVDRLFATVLESGLSPHSS